MHMHDLLNGQKIPALGFGTWEVEPEHAREVVSQALQVGYRLIDTAKMYENEKEVGRAIADSGLPREDIYLTTKLWNDDQGYDSTRAAFETSCRNLGVDYLDLYLIHWPATSRWLDSWRAMNDLYKEGRVQAIGVSNFTIRHLEQIAKEKLSVPLVNQVEFHPFIYDQQYELLNYCYDEGIVVEAYSPLARITKQGNKMIDAIATKYDRTPAQIVLRWCSQHGTVPLARSNSVVHMKENINIFDFELSPRDMHTINSVSDGGRVTWDPAKMG